MARIFRPHPGRTLHRAARKGASLALVAGLMLALPAIGALAPSLPVPLPSPVVRGAEADVRLDRPSVPVRIRIPYAGIDLPVLSSERNVPGNRPGYPLCDVAQYWTRYSLPGAPGTAWIFAHAQEGMFLPLFTISEATDGRGLLGRIVEVQTEDERLLRYRIIEVKERAITRTIARRDSKRDHRLILQTSTGPAGTVPKLQVAAELVSAARATEPAPRARPRACWQPRPTATPRGRDREATPSPGPVETGAGSVDGLALVVGSGAVLLGATFVAVYLVRRQP